VVRAPASATSAANPCWTASEESGRGLETKREPQRSGTRIRGRRGPSGGLPENQEGLAGKKADPGGSKATESRTPARKSRSTTTLQASARSGIELSVGRSGPEPFRRNARHGRSISDGAAAHETPRTRATVRWLERWRSQSESELRSSSLGPRRSLDGA
jgi:hypothetical protein